MEAKPTFLKIFIALIFAFFTLSSLAQTWEWGKSVGGSGANEGYSCATDAAGNVFITGYFSSPTAIFGNDTLTQTGATSIFLVKYDASGNELWAKSAKGTSGNGDEAHCVATDNSGNVYVTGWFSSLTFSFGSYVLNNSGVNDLFLAKYDAAGNIQWAKSATGTLTDYGWSVATDKYGYVYITGAFSSPTITFGTVTLIKTGTTSIFLVKYDLSGNVIWAKSEGGSSDDYAYSTTTDKYGNVCIAGAFTSPTINFGTYTLTNLSTSSGTNIFLAKYDSSGNVLWAKSAGGTDVDIACSVASDATGNVYVTGGFLSENIIFGTDTFTNSSLKESDVFIAKYDQTGNVLWAKSAGGTGTDVGYSLATDISENVYLTGGFSEAASYPIYFGTNTINPLGGYDPIFIVKFDSTGNVLCTSSLSSGGDDRIGVATDIFGNAFVVADMFQNKTLIVGPDTLVLSGTENVFVSKYTCNNILSTTSVSTNSLCHAQCTGTAKIIPVSGTSPYTYSWSSGQTSQTATGLCVGNYTVTITDAVGVSSTNIFIITQPSAITFTSSFTNTCVGNTTGTASVNATGGTPGYSYSWSNGQNVQNATGLSGGTYIISVTDMNGCVDTTSVNISTLSSPTVVLTASNTTICSGQSTMLSASGGGTYNWNTGDTTSSITVFPTAPTTYSVTVIGVNGCTTIDSQTVIVNPTPTAVINGLNAICTGDSSILIASGGTSYHWSTGDTLSSIVVKPTNDSTYKVVVTNKGCKDSTTKTVNVNSYPLASISGTTVICANQSTMLTAFGGGTYLWSTSDTSQQISVMPKTNTIYSVAVTKNGCTSNRSQSVTVNSLPIVDISGGGTITEGKSLQLVASGTGVFLWIPITGLSCNNCSNPIATPEINTNYCVILTDSNDCSNEVCIEIDVNCGAIFVPSAFSPNGDGENDILFVRGKCIETFDFMVFNRWGEKVFETTNQSLGWDGTLQGQACTSDAFTYYLTATLLDGSSVSKKGYIILVR